MENPILNSAVRLFSTMAPYVTFDLTFPHSYSVILLSELPGNDLRRPIYFPGVTTRGGKDGLLLRFTCSNDKQWSGCFAFGDHEMCGVFAVPNPDCVCVVSKGSGYWIYVNEPEKSSQVQVFPIRDVRVVPDARTLLLTDFTSLHAFGSDGQLWKHRVCWDDLKIQDIRAGIVRGVGYDPTNRKQSVAEFAVELATGRVLVSPWH
jgi:hypothetical protein